MTEFQVESLKPVVIGGNFDEMQQALSNMMQAYAGLEVTEENIPERKKDVATLRKMKKAIDDKRKSVKTEYEKPFKTFELKCKELTGIIDTEIERINSDLSAYEAARIAAKRDMIRNIYNEHIEGYSDILPLDAIYDERWENKTCSEKTIISDIQSEKLRVKQDLQTIQIAAGEFADDCLEWYRKCGCDLPAAMRRLEDLKSAKERAKAVLKAEKNFAEEVRGECTKPAETAENGREKWTFTVFTPQDADSVRAYLNMFEIEHKEEHSK